MFVLIGKYSKVGMKPPSYSKVCNCMKNRCFATSFEVYNTTSSRRYKYKSLQKWSTSVLTNTQ